MNKFKEILKKLDPEAKVITESVQNELVTLFEEKDKSIREEAYAKALVECEKKLDAMDEEVTQKTRQLVRRIDESNAKKLKKVVEAMDGSYAKKMKHLVEKIDDKHSDAVKKLVEAIDADVTGKTKKLVEAIDKDHTAKMRKVAEHYEGKLVNEKLAKSVSNYLDEYVKDVMPEKIVVNEAKLGRLEKFYEQLRELVMINDEKFQSEIKEAVLDAKGIIESKDKEIDKLMMEKAELKAKMSIKEAKTTLESKVKDLSPKMKLYLESFFKDADVKTIEGKFDEAVKAYKDEEGKARQKLVESASEKAKVQSPVIQEGEVKPQGQTAVVTEAKDPMLDIYAKSVAKTLRKL